MGKVEEKRPSWDLILHQTVSKGIRFVGQIFFFVFSHLVYLSK